MLLGLGLFLGGCAAAYRTGQTPDDVYYSPAQTSQPVATTNRSSNATAVNEEDGNQYVVYDNQDNNGLTYTQRLKMFDDPNYFYDPFIFYRSYAFSPYYAYSPWYYGYTPWWGSSFSLGLSFGNYYSPFYWDLWAPIGWYAYNSWYSPYWWYSPYYGYGLPYYGYGWASGKVILNPRPANTYAPRVNYGARSATEIGGTTSAPINTNAPRIFYQQPNRSDNPSTSPTPSNTRRIFTTPRGETPINSPANNRRVFIQRSDEHPITSPANNRGFFRMFRSNNNNVSSPNTEFRMAPDRSFEPRSFSAPVFRSAPVENSAPVRTFSPRGGH